MNQIIDNYTADAEQIIHYGFNEPSLTFLTSHKAKKVHINHHDKNKKTLYLVEKKFEDKSNKSMEFLGFKLIDEIKGFNYSRGKDKIIRVYANF